LFQLLKLKKKNSQNVTPLFLNPTLEANNSYEEISYESSSSSSDSESENIEYKNNDFCEIKVYCNIDEKIENNNNNLEEENCLKILKKNSLIDNNNVSKLRKTMKNIHSQSLHKKYCKSSEDVIYNKFNFDNDFAFKTSKKNVNCNDDVYNYLKPQKHLSFCNTKNISILAVLKKSM
jgi:hypothetical protein